MVSLIKKEYFDLVIKLNSANKLKNENTEIYFYIEITDSGVEKLFATIANLQKILLLEKNIGGHWFPKYLSGVSNFEDFLCEIMNTFNGAEELTNYIKLHIFESEN